MKHAIITPVIKKQSLDPNELKYYQPVSTVDHRIMLNRLADEMGLESNVLKWIGSYLSGRTTSVCIDGSLSQHLDLEYGIPQGSIVGPQ